MNRSWANLIAASAMTFGLALAGSAPVPTGAHAERGPDSYPYCAISGMGATICYFDTRAQCFGATGGCIDNPGFDGGNAMAHATFRSSHKPRQ